MDKRKTLDVQKKIFEYIQNHPNISLSDLERAIGTNPVSFREHIKQLIYFGLIREKTAKRQKTYILK